MGKTFEEMQEMYREVVRRFNKIELREWNAQGAMIELSKQVGELAKQVMRLADCYKVDLERAFLLSREDEDQYLISQEKKKRDGYSLAGISIFCRRMSVSYLRSLYCQQRQKERKHGLYFL